MFAGIPVLPALKGCAAPLDGDGRDEHVDLPVPPTAAAERLDQINGGMSY